LKFYIYPQCTLIVKTVWKAKFDRCGHKKGYGKAAPTATEIQEKREVLEVDEEGMGKECLGNAALSKEKGRQSRQYERQERVAPKRGNNATAGSSKGR
jgi:hypothetical protein